MPIGVQNVYNNFEHKNGGQCCRTARVLQRKPPRKSAHKPPGSYADFLVDEDDIGID